VGGLKRFLSTSNIVLVPTALRGFFLFTREIVSQTVPEAPTVPANGGTLFDL
jgi:hypothetical protein